MRIARVGNPGEEVPVLWDDGFMWDLRPVTPDIDTRFFAEDGLARVADARRAGILSELPAAALQRLGAPVARPGAVYCIGMNYAAHARESGAEPPEHLVMFMKAPNTVVGPHDDVAIPPRSSKTDWEVELALVVGSRAYDLADSAAGLACVAGFTVANDLSERDWQLAVSGGQWSKGKSAPGFLPLGPWLASADEFDPTDVRIRSWVNGSPRQDSRTSDLIFDVGTIVADLSRYVVLEPGDVILTGTPEGVALSGRFPYLRIGDVVELEIQGLGRQRQKFVTWGEGK
ncbi:fumarylacetoacetate hydrolase family protein [Microbacterium sp. F51-2R]|uniref:fumarylacetoacetate hydrolase family protein n=1 Tax=Microbacterium sp. F51-2R TaxID=3445777 RepID=UPI003FA0425D